MVRSGQIEIGLGTFIEPTPGLLRASVFRFSLMAVRARSMAKPRQGRLRWADIEPVVHPDLYEIRDRGRRLHDGAERFTRFLKAHIASWANQWQMNPPGELRD
jgi:hypothetical protein